MHTIEWFSEFHVCAATRLGHAKARRVAQLCEELTAFVTRCLNWCHRFYGVLPVRFRSVLCRQCSLGRLSVSRSAEINSWVVFLCVKSLWFEMVQFYN